MEIKQILARVRRLNSKQFKDLIYKLELRKYECTTLNLVESKVLDFDDLEEALTHCIYHYKGGMFEHLGYDICPCQCYCINCEMIPENEVGIRMQEIGFNITEKNVMFEFLENNPDFKLKGLNETKV